MMFRVAHQPSTNPTRCPYRVVVTATGREVGWVNQYLDYETLRRLTDNTLRSYAHELLHFLRWWESVHHTDAVTKDTLTQSTLLDYVRFQSGLQPSCPAAPSTSALPLSIKLYATCSPRLLIRLPRDFSRPVGSAHQWV